MKRLFSSLIAILLAIALTGCVSTSLPTAQTSPWEAVDIHTKSNPLDLAFTNGQHGFLVGSNRLILETNDGGASWTEMALDLPEEEIVKRTKDLPERKSLHARGYTKLYLDHVTQADKGCDFDFLEGDEKSPEPEIF